MRFGIVLSLVAGASVLLTACGKPAAAPPPNPAAAPQANGAMPSVEDLQARAAADEAEADRLLKQAQGQAAPAAPAAGGQNTLAQNTLAQGDEQLHSGQFYDTIEIDAQAGETFHVSYDANGYQPVVIILGPDNKPDSQAVGPAPDAQGQAHMELDTTADRPGKWHALLSAFQPGAGGAYRVAVTKDTATN